MQNAEKDLAERTKAFARRIIRMFVALPREPVAQVLGNLTLNACQSMSATTEKQLTISAGTAADEVWVAIKDTGCGISPENMKKLFEPLFTTKPKGIGLGLVVSKQLIEANGGRIEVHSEENRGSTFTLYLPSHRSAQ